MAANSKSPTPSDDDVMIIDDDSDENSNLDDASTNSYNKASNASDSSEQTASTSCRNRLHDDWGSEEGNNRWPSTLPTKVQYVFRLIGYQKIAGTRRKYCQDCVNYACNMKDDEIEDLERKANVRLTRRQSENAHIQMQLEKLDKMNISDEEKAHQTKQLRMLAFVNPGKFMEDFDPERSTREMKKMNRRIYKEKNQRKNQLYTEQGILLSNNADLCDCLELQCPGCHFPCSKCGSEKCGADCRNNRRWIYEFVDIEGTGKTMSWPVS